MSNPLRVVHVTFGLDVGGLEKMLLQFARVADPSRTQPTFVSLGDNGPVGEQIRDLGFPVVCLHRPTGVRPDLLLALSRLMTNVRPDVVHTHDARALLYGAPAAWLAGVKRVVHTQHGQNLGLSSRQLMLVRQASRLVTHYVCVSDDATQLASELGLPGRKLATVHNGVDLGRFSPPEGLDYHDVDLPALCVARLSPEKGVSNLLKAVSVAVDDAPDFRLEIAGDGPLRDDLQTEAKRLRIEDRVTFLGSVSDVPERMRRARIFVLPSDSEGIALTLLEAMATGLPVVATSVGGTPEVVANEVNGLLAPPSNPTALADAMLRLWCDPLERSRLGEAGRRSVVQRFDIRETISAYEALYRVPATPRIRKTRVARGPQVAGP